MSNVSPQTDLVLQDPQPTSQQRKQSPQKWQERLLPVMTRILVGLTAFFFIATFVQLSYLHWSLMQTPHIDLRVYHDTLPINAETSFDEAYTIRKFEILATLEAYLLERRYYQANVMLMSGLWIRYLGFVTGMILALVGASFILGKLHETTSEVRGKWSDLVDFSLTSASPGIILTVLGTLLMFVNIVIQGQYETNESSVYLLHTETLATLTATPLAPTVLPVTAFDTPTLTGTSDSPPPTPDNFLER